VPYLFGLILAYVLANKITFKLAKWVVICEWLVNSALCLAIVFLIVIPYSESFDYEPVGAAFFAAFHRLGWSVGVGWVVWACVNGFAGF